MRSPSRQFPLRAIFLLVIFTLASLLLAWGWIERRWAAAGFYLAILALTTLFLAPPVWSYTRTSALDETPEADAEDVDGA